MNNESKAFIIWVMSVIWISLGNILYGEISPIATFIAFTIDLIVIYLILKKF